MNTTMMICAECGHSWWTRKEGGAKRCPRCQKRI